MEKVKFKSHISSYLFLYNNIQAACLYIKVMLLFNPYYCQNAIESTQNGQVTSPDKSPIQHKLVINEICNLSY